MTPEGRIKREIDRALLLPGSALWSFKPVQFGYGERALDYVGCVSGKFFAVETKAPGKKPTKFQVLTIQRLRDAGAVVFIISSHEEVLEFQRWLIAQ